MTERIGTIGFEFLEFARGDDDIEAVMHGAFTPDAEKILPPVEFRFRCDVWGKESAYTCLPLADQGELILGQLWPKVEKLIEGRLMKLRDFLESLGIDGKVKRAELFSKGLDTGYGFAIELPFNHWFALQKQTTHKYEVVSCTSEGERVEKQRT